MRLSTQEKREQLTREYDKACEHCRREAEKGQRRLEAISAKLRRLEFAELRHTFAGLVGKLGAVRVRYHDPELNGLVGTVVAVRRTRATVDFGTGGKWNMLLGDLAPTDATPPTGDQAETSTAATPINRLENDR